MSLTSSIDNIESPHFYFELGELVSNTGKDHFAANMLHLVDKRVPVSMIDLSEWTLDERQASILDIKLLGSAGLKEEVPAPCVSSHQDDHPLLKQILEMDDSLLIQMNAQTHSKHTRDTSHQCNLVSRKSNRRNLISLYRPHTQRAFSLSELSFLKNLSETLLPLLERHAQISRQTTLKKLGTWVKGPVAALKQTQLQREFYERLSLSDITLSAREKEVCLGLLTGGTVPEMAEKLSVKNSSIETYLKRAAAKLGVSGRHGLAKWMVGA
ncbi:helix-turn-helix transcriptional regulator [Pseudomonas purpurea]|uniref:helix-turn-helix transcriptional regulator n=1 Tax=Pseudomonas purpurea TaxID=3136737 RepID=UPI0032667EC4